MSLHELPLPDFDEEETFEQILERSGADMNVWRPLFQNRDAPENRRKVLACIDELFQIVLTKNCSEEERNGQLAFLTDLRKFVADRDAYLAEMRQEELEHQAELAAWLEDVKNVCKLSR